MFYEKIKRRYNFIPYFVLNKNRFFHSKTVSERLYWGLFYVILIINIVPNLSTTDKLIVIGGSVISQLS